MFQRCFTLYLSKKQNFSFLMKEAFLNHIKTQRRYSLHTINAYRNDLNQLEAFLHADFESVFLEANTDMIRSWVVNLFDSGVSKTTIHRKVSSIKSFYHFLIREDQIKVNPVLLVHLPRKEKKLPVFLVERQTDFLIDEVVFSSDFKGLRDKLILKLLYYTGMRRAELISLTDSSFSVESKYVKVMGKRRKERIIPLSDEVIDDVNAYVCVRDEFFNGEIEDAFFVTEKGGIVYPNLIYRIVKAYLSQVSTASKKSPHVLRHTFATQMLNNGADINAVKELLGHASLAATQVYTHNTIDKIKSIYKSAHPRA